MIINNLKKMTLGLALFLGLTFQTMAAVERAVVLQGSFTANTEITALVYNALPVTVRLKIKRDGSDNNFAERLASSQLILPNGDTKTVTRSIGSTEETFEINLPAAGGSNACRTWRVRLVNLEANAHQEVNQAIRGSVEFLPPVRKQTRFLRQPNLVWFNQAQLIKQFRCLLQAI